MIKEMNRMKQDIKKKEEATIEMQNKSVQHHHHHVMVMVILLGKVVLALKHKQRKNLLMKKIHEIYGDKQDAMTQTIVDEECLWESEETYVVAISGPVLENMEKNEAVEKFYGEYVAKRKQDPLAGPDEDPAIETANGHSVAEKSYKAPKRILNEKPSG